MGFFAEDNIAIKKKSVACHNSARNNLREEVPDAEDVNKEVHQSDVHEDISDRYRQIERELGVYSLQTLVPECPEFLERKAHPERKEKRNGGGEKVVESGEVSQDIEGAEVNCRRCPAGRDIFENAIIPARDASKAREMFVRNRETPLFAKKKKFDHGKCTIY